MVYKGPEQDPSYIAYWNQYPDPVDIVEGTPTWLVHFESNPSDITAVAEDVENRVENDGSTEEDDEEEEAPMFEKYTTSPRQTEERIPAVKLDYSQLPSSAVDELAKYQTHIDACKTQREQIVKVVDILRPSGNHNALASWTAIGKVFHLSKGAVNSNYSRGIEATEVGRISFLDDEEINILIEFVIMQFHTGPPPTYDVLIEFIKNQFNKSIMSSTLYKLIKKIPQLKPVTGTPMESERVLCDPDSIDEYYDNLEKILDGSIPAAFVFNIDEVGFSEWADATTVTVIVPSDFTCDDIKIPVPRAGKRASMVACISADGESINPGITVPRSTIEVELLESGYTPDKVCITHQENGFYDTKSFCEWAESIFFPEIQRRREKYDYEGECVCIIDGFGPHDCDWFLDTCTENGVIPLPLPPHSSDQCQPLDLGIFHVQKLRSSRMSVDKTLSTQTQQIIRMIDSFRQATTISNVISAFRVAGIKNTYDRRTNMLVPRVDRSEAIKVRHWVYTTSSIPNKQRIKL